MQKKIFKISIFIIILLLIIFIKSEHKFTDQTIFFGSSLPKTGIMKDWGRNVEIGTNAYFDFVNEKNILSHNRKIKLIALDDKYEPDLTVENTKLLLEKDDLFAFYGYVGTPTVKKILPILEKNDVPFIAPFTGASFLRDKNSDFVNLNFRTSYNNEIDKLVDYLSKKRGIEKFAVFYQNDPYGEEGYIALINSLRNRGLALNGEGMYKRNTLSIKHAFSEIKDSNPQAIVMIGAYKANALFIKKAKEDPKLKDTIFCSISFSDADEMIKDLEEVDKNNLIFSQVVPSFKNFKIDVIREYKYSMERYYPKEPLGFISLEAFLVAKSVVAALGNVKGVLTRSKFVNEYKKLPKNTLKGIDTKYENEQLSNKVYLFKYENNNFIEISDND